MKPAIKFLLVIPLLFAVLLAFPGTVHAQSSGDDQVVFGGTYTLASGQELNGNLLVLGGVATIEEGAQVNGDVAVMGGALSIAGEVNGNVAAAGGSVSLTDTAVINGDVSAVGSALNRSDKAVINGSVNTTAPGNFRLSLPDMLKLPTPAVPAAKPFALDFSPITKVMWAIFQALAAAALALLVVMFLPQPSERVSQSITSQPLVSGAYGLLTAIVAPVLLVMLLITIILSPLALLGVLLLAVAVFFGYIIVGLETGRRLAGLFKSEWNAPVAAAVGTLVMSLVVSAVAAIPCVGWVLGFLVSIVGLGGVIISRFGTRSPLQLPPVAAAPIAPAAPVEPPTPPDETDQPA